MATPVFAELKMPELATSAAGPGVAGPQPGTPVGPSGSASPASSGGSAGAGGSGGPPRPAGIRIAWLPPSRRGLVLTAPLVASAIVAGIVFLAFPGFGDSLTGGLALLPGNKLGSRPPENTGQGIERHGSSQRGSGSKGGQGPAGNPQPSATHRATRGRTPPGPSNRPTPSGKPSPSSQPTPTTSPSPSPTPSQTSPAPKAGELPA